MSVLDAKEDWQITINGVIQKGNQQGRLIDHPTINIKITQDFPIKNGVYLARVIGLESTAVYGHGYIGTRPTFNEKERMLEVNLLNFDRNVYGQTVKVELLSYIRDEVHFSSVGDLRNELNMDNIKIEKMLMERGLWFLNNKIDGVNK